MLTLDLVGAVALLLLVEEEGAHLGQLRPADFHLFFLFGFVWFRYFCLCVGVRVHSFITVRGPLRLLRSVNKIIMYIYTPLSLSLSSIYLLRRQSAGPKVIPLRSLHLYVCVVFTTTTK